MQLFCTEGFDRKTEDHQVTKSWTLPRRLFGRFSCPFPGGTGGATPRGEGINPMFIRSRFVLVLVLLLSVSGARAADSDSVALEMTGFRMEQDGLHATTWSFRDQLKLIISKKRFMTEKAAQEFCKSYRSTLDTEFSALLIAMSGASSQSKVLHESISWKIQDRSGIWQWVGKDRQILVLTDGEGMREEVISEKQLTKLAPEGVPAICVSQS